MTNMEIFELKKQITGLVQSMSMEQILDAQFNRVQALQDETNPNFVSEVLHLFCNDVQTVIVEFNNNMCQPNVDYQKLQDYAHKLKGSCACIGAHRIKLASANLLQASEDKNKEGCVQAVNKIAGEYYLLRSKFQVLVQIEEKIVDIANQQREQESIKQGAE